MIYTVARTHARLLAKDPNGNVSDTSILALFQDVYTSYWESFLKDRVQLVDSFVQFSTGEYMVEAAYACRDVQSIARNAVLPQVALGGSAAPYAPAERDDFEAVAVDAENAGANASFPIRFGVRMKEDNSQPVIVIHPPVSANLILDAYVYPLCNTLSTTSPVGDLRGDDNDGYAVARLVACEVMGINGEAQEDIQGVFNLLDQKVQDKFKTMRWRAQPRDREDKEQ